MPTYRCTQCRSENSVSESMHIFSQCAGCHGRSVRVDPPSISNPVQEPIAALRYVLENSADPAARLGAVVPLVRYLQQEDNPEAANEILLTLMNDYSGEVILGTAYLLTTLSLNRYQQFVAHLLSRYPNAGERSTSDGAPLLRMAYVPALANDLETVEKLLALRSSTCNGMARVVKLRDLVALGEHQRALALAAWSEGLDAQFNPSILSQHVPLWAAARIMKGSEMAARGEYTVPAVPRNDSAAQPVAASTPSFSARSPVPAVLSEDLFQPVAADNSTILETIYTGNVRELAVEGGIHNVFFDDFRRMLLVQHQPKQLTPISAWEYDSWKSIPASWPFAADSILGHGLVSNLGSTLEMSADMLNSRRLPSGSWWHVGVNAPIRAFDFSQQAIQLVWQSELGKWVSGVATNILGIPHYTAGAKHLAMDLGLGSRTLRVIRVDSEQIGDFDQSPFRLNFENTWPTIEFGPDDQYVLVQIPPKKDKEGRELAPWQITAYSPNSTTPIAQRRLRWTAATPPAAWSCGSYVSAWNELYGNVGFDNAFLLVDLVQNSLLADPISPETKIKAHLGFVGNRATVSFIREPNVLEVHQFGRSPSLILQLDLDAEFAASGLQPGAVRWSHSGRYLLLESSDKSRMRIYTFEQSDRMVKFKSLPCPDFVCEKVSLAAPAQPAPPTAGTATLGAATLGTASTSQPKQTALPNAAPAASAAPKATTAAVTKATPANQATTGEVSTGKAKPRKRSFVRRAVKLLALTILLAVVYLASVGPVLQFSGAENRTILAQIYRPHAELMKFQKPRHWITAWCQICQVPQETMQTVLSPDAASTLVVKPPVEALPATNAPPAGGTSSATTAASPTETPVPATVVPAIAVPAAPAPASPPAVAGATAVASPPQSTIPVQPTASPPITSRRPAAPGNSPASTTPAGGQPMPTSQAKRTWTDITGRKIEAQLLSWDGEVVELLTAAGKKGKVPFSRLSPADQQFLKSLPR